MPASVRFLEDTAYIRRAANAAEQMHVSGQVINRGAVDAHEAAIS